MTAENIKDLKLVKLNYYLTPEKFRTVPRDAVDVPGGISEVQVIFYLHENFMEKLTFDHSSIMVLYGYARLNDVLRKINKYEYTTKQGKGVLKRIVLNDCSEVFIMVFEVSDSEDKLVTVKAEEVLHLLNDCMHPEYRM
jgi:hypothetical protein